MNVRTQMIQDLLDELDQLLAVSDQLRVEARYWRFASTLKREQSATLHARAWRCQHQSNTLRARWSRQML